MIPVAQAAAPKTSLRNSGMCLVIVLPFKVVIIAYLRQRLMTPYLHLLDCTDTLYVISTPSTITFLLTEQALSFLPQKPSFLEGKGGSPRHCWSDLALFSVPRSTVTAPIRSCDFRQKPAEFPTRVFRCKSTNIEKLRCLQLKPHWSLNWSSH